MASPTEQHSQIIINSDRRTSAPARAIGGEGRRGRPQDDNLSTRPRITSNNRKKNHGVVSSPTVLIGFMGVLEHDTYLQKKGTGGPPSESTQGTLGSIFQTIEPVKLSAPRFLHNIGASFGVLDLAQHQDTYPQIETVLPGSKAYQSSMLGQVRVGVRFRSSSSSSTDEGDLITSPAQLHDLLDWADYLGISNIIIESPASQPHTEGSEEPDTDSEWILHLARELAEFLDKPMFTTLTLKVHPGVVGWRAWNAIRTVCRYSPKLYVGLDLSSVTEPAFFASGADITGELDFSIQWRMEPLKLVIMDLSCVQSMMKIISSNGVSTDSPVDTFASLNPFFFLEDISIILQDQIPVDSKEGRSWDWGDMKATLLALRQFIKSKKPPQTHLNLYQESLFTPLQPLINHLPSETYEGFELDPVKYVQYERAIREVLMDIIHIRIERLETRFSPSESSNPMSERMDDPDPICIMICGAGRGPLIGCAIRALTAVNAKESIIVAVEKNPHAYRFLLRKAALEWSDVDVRLIQGDIRFIPESGMDIPKCHILVSELLGSFGDNELSPECIDAAQRFLLPEGISIPSSYCSYLAPISCPTIYAKLLRKDASALEMPYVVKFDRNVFLNSPALQWNFCHTQMQSSSQGDGSNGQEQNKRFAKTKFIVPYTTVIHGFAGFFDACLYADVKLSILPDEHSEGMFSWFPYFFPLSEPMYLEKGAFLDVYLWRQVEFNSHRVWYEWLAVPNVAGDESALGLVGGGNFVGDMHALLGRIQNAGGRASFMQM